MPKATRAKEDQEAPKKRSRKAKPADGDGTGAVDPVTTAPAIAETTSEISAQQPETAAKRSRKTKPVEEEVVTAVAAAVAAPVVESTRSAAQVSVTGNPVTQPKANGHATEDLKPSNGHGNGHVPEELVRRRAYELYLERRGQGGSPEQDWFRALQEIRGQHVA